jgi:hypothetical protein
MRTVWVSGVIAILAASCGQPSTPSTATDQPPPIGIVDLFGRRRVLEADVRAALGVTAGQPVPDDAEQRAARERLIALSGIRDARFEIVCCDDAHSILYVGIEENDAPAWTFRPKPTGRVRLPDEIVRAGAEYEEAMIQAVLAGRAGQDVSRGHALSEDPAARALEDRFVTFATEYQDALRRALRESRDDNQRALAAQVLGYTADKQSVIADLVEAVDDQSDDVRNNAMRALGVISAAEDLPREVRAAVPAAPFIRLVNSPIWSDRNKALMVLEGLTSGAALEPLAVLRRDTIPSLVEMARWKSEGHALPAFILLGRLAGLGDEEIFDAWKRGERERVIAAAAQSTDATPTERLSQ